MLNEQAVRIATKVVKLFEGCHLAAYPDPASDLYAALSNNGLLQKYMAGKLKWQDLGKNFQAISGAPWTCGWGETQGVTKDTVYTQQEADMRLDRRIREFMEGAIRITPKLSGMNPSQIAAITSFCYNVGFGDKTRGIEGYSTSTTAKMVQAGNVQAAADWMLPWNKGNGKIISGLVRRRETERNLMLSTN